MWVSAISTFYSHASLGTGFDPFSLLSLMFVLWFASIPARLVEQSQTDFQ